MVDPDSSAPGAEPSEDGRRQRAERNRTAVVDALLSLYDEGNVRPGAAEIAARAGVSPRSVFRHFDDLEALAAATIERQWSRVRHLFEPPASGGDATTRVEALVAQRLRLYGVIIGVARAATLLVLSSPSPTLTATVRDRRRLLADQVTTLFGPELDAVVDAERRRIVAAALEAAASLETIEHLRAHAQLDRDRTAAVMRHTLRAVLTTAEGNVCWRP